MNNISKTIMESVAEVDEKFHLSDRQVAREHLLQSQIRLIEAVIESLEKESPNFKFRTIDEEYNIQCNAYKKALEDQISSLNETLEFIKKSL